jgi:uncharacterized membrane protein YhaH (DUF805 family)
MLLSVIVCAVLLLSGPALVEEDIGPLDLPVEKSVSGGSDLWIFLAFIVFLIALFVVVAVLSFREQRRLRNAKQSSGPKAA